MADDCESLGFVMDCGDAFGEKYGRAVSDSDELEAITCCVAMAYEKYTNHVMSPLKNVYYKKSGKNSVVLYYDIIRISYYYSFNIGICYFILRVI